MGSIVVSVMLDYRTLPFIEPQSPYLESLQPDRQTLGEGAVGRDVEFVVYGWSRAPIYASGTSVWPLPDPVFQRMVESREPFWATIARGPEDFRVFFMSDRGGIYALGYPVITPFGHLMNVAELVFLAGVLYVALVLGATLINAITSRTPASGRALLREIRASFYRKLFLAFGAAAVVPVVILAIAIRTYFATQLRAGIEEAAAKTALVAQRLVEDYATLQQRGAGALAALDDQIMVLVRRAIDQDVNLFEGPQLQATSERDLFASGLLPTRTPADVYRRIVLDRLPTFVSEQEAGYLLAAAPVRAGGLRRDRHGAGPAAPAGNRAADRRSGSSGAVAGGALQPARRGAGLLDGGTDRRSDQPADARHEADRARQSRRARGHRRVRRAGTADQRLQPHGRGSQAAADRARTDAAARSVGRHGAPGRARHQEPADADSAVRRARAACERGSRAAAVAGARRLHRAILSQVRLLRQIAAEFSSFASAATPRPAPTRVAELVEEVIGPYRVGLAGRIALEFNADAKLPTINVDRTLLARAITNVIENALHAMPGTGTLSIVVRVRGSSRRT